MRLRNLTLDRYAVFDHALLTLDPTPGCVNLIVAPNGAGKSVLVDAFSDLLFGIHAQSPMAFRFDDYAGMRLKADTLIDGAAVTLVRRKGLRNTLTDGDSRPIDPATMKRWLGSIADRERLQRLFALDSHRLRQAEGLLLNTDGDLADALLSGTGDLHSARELRNELTRRRDEIGIAGGRGDKRPLNKAMGDWEKAGQRLRGAIQSPDQHAVQDRQYQQALAAKAEAEARHTAALAELARFSRLRGTQPAAALRKTALDALAALPDLPLLDPAVTQQLDKAEMDSVRAADRLADARRLAEQAARQAAGHDIPLILLAAGEALDAVAAEIGAVRKAQSDRPALQRDRDAAWRRAETLVAHLGWSMPPQQAERALPARSVAAAAQVAIAAFNTARDNAVSAADRLFRAGQAARQSATALASLPVADYPPGLDVLMQEIRLEGSPVQRRSAAAADIARAAAALDACLARIPGWGRGAAALLALAPPDLRALERLHRQVQDTDTAMHAAEQRLAERTADAARQRTALAETIARGAPPDDAALAAARAHRERGWALLRARAFGGGPDWAAEARYDKLALELAYPLAVQRADAFADERFEAATQLAAIDEANKRLDRTEGHAATALATLQEVVDLSNQARAGWRIAVAPLQLGDGADLAEARDLLAARDSAVEATERLALARDAARQLAEQHASWTARLACKLGVTGGELATLLSEADRRLGDANRVATRRAALVERADADARLEREAHAEQTRTEAALAACREDWAGHLRALNRSEGEPPDVTVGSLSLFEELREECKLAGGLDQRVVEIDQLVAGFAVRVGAALAAAGRGGGADPFAAADAAIAALQAGRRLADIAAKERQDAEKAALDCARAQQADQDAQSALRAVLALCSAPDTAAARLRLEQSAARRGWLTRRDEAEQRLLEAGAGMALEAVLAEAASVPPDALPQLREDAGRVATEQFAAQSTAAVRANELRRQLGQDEDAEEVGHAAASLAAAQSTVERTAEEAAVLHLALAMLERGLKLVEEAGGDAGLARIGEIFRRLTGEAYSAVEAIDVGGAARLRVIDANWPKEHKSMSQLSEGTRDQLCLALRLAAIEDHVKVAPALPFIGDDILQTFDDDRALASLAALADLAQHVQVIVLTHHRHLLTLAGRLPVHIQLL